MTISPPNTLCIYTEEDAKEFFIFTEALEDLFYSDEQITIDLRNIKEVTAAAAVLFFATVNSLQIIAKDANVINFIFPQKNKHPIAYDFVIKRGLSKALNSGSLEKLSVLVDQQDFFQSHTNANEHVSSLVNYFTKKLNLESGSPKYLNLSAAINEAMLNVAHHAYRNPDDDRNILTEKIHLVEALGERWWIGSMSEGDEVTLIICDLGQGIQFSYAPSLKNFYDETWAKKILLEAFSLGNSRIKNRGRGNGSEDIKRGVHSQHYSTEVLLVYSKGLKYYYKGKSPEPEVEAITNYFNGTLVEWTIKLGTK